MGVVCVLKYPVPEGKTGTQVVDALQRKLEQLGAVRTGNFLVDCETYHQAQMPQRVCHMLHNSEQPASCFAVLDSGRCLVADTMFDALMQKLKGIYTSRKNSRIESKGQRYEFGDFVIKIGSVVLGTNTSFKGVLVEVEYCPCFVPADCWSLLKEFLVSFLGNTVDSVSNHFKSKMDELVAPADTVVQYLEHFNNFKKAANTITIQGAASR